MRTRPLTCSSRSSPRSRPSGPSPRTSSGSSLGPLAPESRPLALLQRPHPLAGGHFEQFLDSPGSASRSLLIVVFVAYARLGNAVHAGVRRRADRHRDAARDARLRARLARARARSRSLARGGSGATTCSKVGYAEVILGGWLGLGFTFLRSVDRRRDRDGPRALPAAALVDRGRAGLRRHRRCCRPSSGPYLVGGAFAPADDPQLAAAAKRLERNGGRLRHAGPRAGRPRRHARGERVHDGRRAEPRRCSSGTRCSTAGLERAAAARSCSPTSSATRPATTSWKAIAWYALFTFPDAYLIALVARRRGGMSRAEAIPLALLVVVRLHARQRLPLEASSSATSRPRRTGWRCRRRATRPRFAALLRGLRRKRPRRPEPTRPGPTSRSTTIRR